MTALASAPGPAIPAATSQRSVRPACGTRARIIIPPRPAYAPFSASPEATVGPADPFLRTVRSRPAAEVNPHLWTWQQEALDVWHRSDCRGVVEAVTGAGKTLIGVTAAFEAFTNGIKTLVLVPTAELQSQWQRRLHQTIPQAIVGTLGNGRSDSLADCDILVSVVNSAARRTLLADHQQGLLIADEAHRYAAPTFIQALSERFAYRLGLTATYARQDEAHTAELDPYFGGVIYRLWYSRALADGVIAPFDLAFVGVDLTPTERTVYDDASTTMSKVGRGLSARLNLGSVRGNAFFKRIQGLAGRKDDHSPECIMARKYMDAMARRQRVLSKAEGKLALLRSLGETIEHSSGTLVFAETIDTSTAAGDVLRTSGIATEVISSESHPRDRRGALQRFALGHAQALCAPRILDEGIDVPAADLAVVISATRQPRQAIQRLGRVIRRKPNGAAGRYVHLYARGTVEDVSASVTDRFAPIVEAASRVGRFTEQEIPELLEFLSAGRTGQPDQQPSSAPAPEPSPTPESSTQSGPAVLVYEAETTSEPQPDEPTAEAPNTEPIILEIEDDDEQSDDGPRPRLGQTTLDDDLVKQYLREIGNPGLLTAEEEVELGKTIEAGLYAEHLLGSRRFSARAELRELEWVVADGIRAKERFVACNLRLVVSIAKRYISGSHTLDFLDLIQEGNLGLVRAVEKFDYTKGNKFSTYATWWIRQAITRALADTGRTIRFPVHVVEKLNAWWAAPAEHAEDADTCAALLRMQPSSLDTLLELQSWASTRDDSRSMLDDITMHTDRVLPDPVDGVLFDELRVQVNAVLDALPERDAAIIRGRHGWFTGEPETLDAIGQRFGVTRERIRQLEKKAMTALRLWMVDGDASALLHKEVYAALSSTTKRRKANAKPTPAA